MHITLAQIEYFKHSKMRDADGNLTTYWHGTKKDFDRFTEERILSEPGFWFTEDRNYAAHHGDRILQVYLNVTNPFMLNDWQDPKFVQHYNRCFKNAEFSERNVYSFTFRDYLINHGYDGLMLTSRGYYIVIAFCPEQIKAIDNYFPTLSPIYTK